MAKGVEGFRFDVVNLISKGEFKDDYEGDGRRFYTDGPNIHKYLQELNETTFGTDAEIITVGEMSSTSHGKTVTAMQMRTVKSFQWCLVSTSESGFYGK